MDNNIQTNKEPNLKLTFDFINNTYDSLSYFDLYGNSVMIFMFMTLVVFMVYTYCKTMSSKEDIVNDWPSQRCNPKYIPIAGLITHPEGTTAFQYTNDNFQYCVQDILKNVTGYALQPFQYMLDSITKVFSQMVNSIQQTREVTNTLRNGIRDFAEDVLGRILNFTIPLQQMLIALSDTFQKIQGVMTGGLYTMLGSYYALQSLMGAILELIIKLLVALVIIIIGLWITPFTFPAAAATTAVFLSISVPLAIIIIFMTEVLHIKSSKIPKLRCFDEKTRVFLSDGSFKFIKDIKLNDRLHDGSIVTAKIKVTSENLAMYNLKGTIVSESHIVKYRYKWIPVREHPLAIRLYDYSKPYLYCLNTSSNVIILNNIVYTDWDEIYDDNSVFLKNYILNDNVSTVYKGFEKETKILLENGEKAIEYIQIGDVLSTKGIVYGIVELNSLGDLGNKNVCYNLLVSNGIFKTGSKTYADYNYSIDSILELRKILSN